MTAFVYHFSTAQDEVGYVLIDNIVDVPTEESRQSSVPRGVYRVEGGRLILVELADGTGGAIPEKA